MLEGYSAHAYLAGAGSQRSACAWERCVHPRGLWLCEMCAPCEPGHDTRCAFWRAGFGFLRGFGPAWFKRERIGLGIPYPPAQRALSSAWRESFRSPWSCLPGKPNVLPRTLLRPVAERVSLARPPLAAAHSHTRGPRRRAKNAKAGRHVCRCVQPLWRAGSPAAGDWASSEPALRRRG